MFNERFEEAFANGFKSSSDVTKELREKRFALEKLERIKFGLPFIDRALRGIAKDDLIVVSAKTGVGKSEFCTTVTLSALSQNKKVFYFALEYSYGEVEERMLFRRISKMYWSDENREQLDNVWTYSNFHDGILKKAVEKYYDQAIEEQCEANKNLFILYKEKNFDIERFSEEFKRLRGLADLVIIDHLQYFDIDHENENVGATEIIKAIRHHTTTSDIPVILVSHVRKSHFNDKKLVPSYEDIYGSSNIFKAATGVIILGPKYDAQDPDIAKTWIHIAKNRMDNSLRFYMGLQDFNLRTNSYAGNWQLHKVIKGGTETEFIDMTTEDGLKKVPRALRR